MPLIYLLYTLAASVAESVRRSVRLSVCPVNIFIVTHQRAARDAASVHFRPRITRTDILFAEHFTVQQ